MSTHTSQASIASLVALLGSRRCDVLVQNTVKELGDGAIYDLLPQIATGQNAQGIDPRLDYDNNGAVGKAELRAALILAARVAHTQQIALEDVPAENLAQFTEGCKISSILSGRPPAYCEARARR